MFSRTKPLFSKISRIATLIPICKNSVVEPFALAAIQTDGSFRKNISRTAIILDTVQGEQFTLVNTYFTHANSYESEWCSVLNGLEFALKKKQTAVTLENDNQGVIKSLITQTPPKVFWRYYDSIHELLETFKWVSVRWIPREQNKADRLFRI
jgi:ribonuclease HI